MCTGVDTCLNDISSGRRDSSTLGNDIYGLWIVCWLIVLWWYSFAPNFSSMLLCVPHLPFLSPFRSLLGDAPTHSTHRTRQGSVRHRLRLRQGCLRHRRSWWIAAYVRSTVRSSLWLWHKCYTHVDMSFGFCMNYHLLQLWGRKHCVIFFFTPWSFLPVAELFIVAMCLFCIVSFHPSQRCDDLLLFIVFDGVLWV